MRCELTNAQLYHMKASGYRYFKFVKAEDSYDLKATNDEKKGPWVDMELPQDEGKCSVKPFEGQIIDLWEILR